MNTTIDRVIIHLTVNTLHGHQLEFVLDHTGDKQSKSYYDLLVNMVEKKIKPLDCYVSQYGAYGDVWLEVVTYNSDFTELKQLVDKAVASWVNKYRINSMKE